MITIFRIWVQFLATGMPLSIGLWLYGMWSCLSLQSTACHIDSPLCAAEISCAFSSLPRHRLRG